MRCFQHLLGLRRFAPSLLFAAVCAAAPATVSAQTCSTTGSACNVLVTVSAGRIPFTAQMTTTAATSAIGMLTSAMMPANVASSTVATAGPTITARANADFSVTIAAQRSTWLYSGPFTDPAKSAGDLSFRTGAGAFTAVSTAGASVVSGDGGDLTTGALSFQTTWAWTTAKPGTYRLPLTITLTAP